MKSRLPMFLGFMLLLLVRIATSQDGSGEYYGSGDCEGSNQALTLDGECAERCSEGHVWCPGGSTCSIEGAGDTGYRCPCINGYYDDESGNCVLGRFFGGKIFFGSDDTSEKAFASRDLSTDCTTDSVNEVIIGIYDNDAFYVNHTILDEDDASCSATYQLLFENNFVVNDEYLKGIFTNKSGCDDTANSTVYVDLNCTASYKSVVVPSIICGPGGEYSGYCQDPDTCSVSVNGIASCVCPTGFGLAYNDATSCEEATCVDDEGCNFGTCSQEPNVLERQCTCTWGFTGANCTDPWWLVFTVLTAALGIFLIIVIICCCACTSKSTKTTKENVEADELDFKNPFVDFQPGVRAKVSSNIYNSVSDPLSTQSSQGHSNPAFNNNAYDDTPNKTSGNSAAQGNEYF